MTNHIQDVDHGDFEICVYQSNLNGQYSFDIRNMHGEVVESYSGFKTKKIATDCATRIIENYEEK